MTENFFKFQKIFILFCLIFLKVKFTISRDKICYTPIFLETSWTDRRPIFKVNMTFTKHGSIRSLTWIQNDIPAPIAEIKITQKEERRVTTLYNVTARLCDVQQFLEKIPIFKQLFQTATKQGNYSFSCPMKHGFYIMENLRFPNKNPFIGFMYRPKTSFTFMGGLYEEASNKSLLALSTYKFTIKIVKKSCKE